LHVVTRPIIMSSYGIPANVVNVEIEREQEVSLAQVKNYEKIAKDEGAQEVSSTVILGPAVDSILHQATSLSADMIIIGTHGHGALYNLLMGSTAKGIISKSPCPVLIIPPRKDS